MPGALRPRPALSALAVLAVLSSCGPASGPAPTPRPSTGSGATGSNSNGGSGGEAPRTAPTIVGANATIGPGFGTLTLSGAAGGPYASSVIGGTCTGYMTGLPSHVVEVTADVGMVTLEGSATIDTVLFVRTSTGEVLCDDDGGGYPNPHLAVEMTPGRYQIWYATYSPGGVGDYTLTLTEHPMHTVGSFAGVPSYCGLATADYGPITVGTSVVLGAHTGWTGPDGHGGTVTDDTWWADPMWTYVGQRTVVTELAGLDPVGCPYVRVAIDGGSWGWRIRDLSP